MVVHRNEIWLINLDPTIGKEINKTRPCMVISPDEANKYLNTIIVAPLTSTIKNYPSRVDCVFKRKKGQVVIDQIRAIDKLRLIKKIGLLSEETNKAVFELIGAYFAE